MRIAEGLKIMLVRFHVDYKNKTKILRVNE